MEMISIVVSVCFKFIVGYKEGVSLNVKDFLFLNDE